MGIVEEMMIYYLNLLKPSKEIIKHNIEFMKKISKMLLITK